MSEDWFDVLKSSSWTNLTDYCNLSESPGTNVIRKTPFTNAGKRWYWMQVEDIPGLKEAFDISVFPFGEVWRDTAVEAYPMSTGTIESMSTNLWIPKISGRKNAVMVANVYNIEQQKLKFDWEFGSLIPNRKDPDAEMLARGKKKFPLGEKEIGVIIMQDVKKERQRIEVSVPVGSKFYENLGQFTHGSTYKDYEFTNAEAAALGILSHHERKQGGKNFMKRRQMFEQFGIGPLSKDTEAKEIVSLTKKGLIRREPNHNTPNMRNFPIISAKGKAAATVVDMPLHIFIGKFKEVVLKSPDALFDMLYIDPRQEGLEE